MKSTLSLIISIACFATCLSRALPDTRNPNLEYELINVLPQNGSKPGVTGLAPLTPTPPSSPQQPPITNAFNTPPPVDPNSKTFAYDAKSQMWTLIKKNDPQPDGDTLLWNQSNDKWLTQTPRS